uniref:Uncharacterized protein n=1 Tax=Heterorhabditis bacteriophora TaxID=37862 RepID=A0A1I7WFE9_HETBA
MEDAKNMALLFFMDHLIQKNGRRTIHDLSCQFGARGTLVLLQLFLHSAVEFRTHFLFYKLYLYLRIVQLIKDIRQKKS